MDFNKDSLLYRYRWVTTPADEQRGDPASHPFERDDGDQVLRLIKEVMAAKKVQSSAFGRKIETMIRHYPAHLQNWLQVKAWIMAHWDRY